MQSVHACACFVRVGRCCLGSILGSILESFWEPGGALYSFWGDFFTKNAPRSETYYLGKHSVDLGRLGPRGGSELNVVFEAPWGGQQEGRGRTTEISHAWRPQGVGGLIRGVLLIRRVLFMRSALLAENRPDETFCFIGFPGLTIYFMCVVRTFARGVSADGFINPKRRLCRI